MKTLLAIILLSLSALGQNPPKPEALKPVPMSDAAQVKVLKAMLAIQTWQHQMEAVCAAAAKEQKIDQQAFHCDPQQLAFVPNQSEPKAVPKQ